MTEDINKELAFKNRLEEIVEGFGEASQDGAKLAIRECQEEFGCVSLSHQSQIAEAFSLKDNIIKTVMRFMPSIKESIVEYEVVCCSGSRCAKNGSMEVIKEVKDTLGLDFDKVSEDGRIRLSMQNCFKQCGVGPNIMVNGRLYNHMDKDKARNLMKEIKSK